MTTERPPADRPARRWLRRAAIFVAVNLFVWLTAGVFSALAVTGSRPSELPRWRTLAGRPIEELSVETRDGVIVRASLVDAGPTDAARRAVVLVGGIGRNRAAMADRARWYVDRGISALLVDLRGTGDSDAHRLSFGWHESLDLIAWFDLLRTRGFTSIGAHGQSVGAAAVTYSFVRGEPQPAWSFAVLEMCYRDVRSVISTRTPFLPMALSWPMIAGSEWLADFDADALVPIDAVRAMRCPTLVVAGDADATLGEDATRLLVENCGGSRVEQLLVHGAGHVDLWPVGGDRLRAALGAFLDGL